MQYKSAPLVAIFALTSKSLQGRWSNWDFFYFQAQIAYDFEQLQAQKFWKDFIYLQARSGLRPGAVVGTDPEAMGGNGSYHIYPFKRPKSKTVLVFLPCAQNEIVFLLTFRLLDRDFD
eukprot:scpid33141/ scgid10739/ 